MPFSRPLSRLFWAGVTVLGFAAGWLAPVSSPAVHAAVPTSSGPALAMASPLPGEVLTPSVPEDERRPDMPPKQTYAQVLGQIQSLYYPTNTAVHLDKQELTYAAIRGMLASLGDRYTRFLDPEQWRKMEEDNRGEFGGIGALLEHDPNTHQVVVQEVLANTPAQRSGLKAGDSILAVNGISLQDESADKAVDMIRGKRGTRVSLQIARKSVPKPFTLEITRALIQSPTVESAMLAHHIGYIRLNVFNELSDELIDQKLGELDGRGMKALILDLRHNPGGLLTEAQAIASRFMRTSDTPVVTIQDHGGHRHSLPVDTTKQHEHPQVPLVVLVDEMSASASEIVAGAIKDTHSGLLVGTTTFGKFLVQTINPIPADGSAVLITTHHYYPPDMEDLNKKGIKPDVFVADPPDLSVESKMDPKLDPQLRRAIAILNGGLSGTQAASVDGTGRHGG